MFADVLPILRHYDTSAQILNHDIKSLLQSPTTAANLLGAKNRHDRKNLVEMVVHYQLVQCLMKVYQVDPSLAFNQVEGSNTCLQDSLQLMNGLVSLVQHQSPPFLPLRVSEVLLELHKPNNIVLWDRSDVMTAFWDISGTVTYSITQKLFSRKTADPLQLLKWLRKILHYRTKFLSIHPASEVSQGVSGKISQQLYTMLETVLLLFLRHTSVEAVHIAMICFKYLVSEAELVSSPSEPVGVPYAPNLHSYKLLAEASKTPHIGRVAQQTQVRAILRELVHTPGSALAWEDTYASWRVSKSLLSSYQRDTHNAPIPDTFHRSMIRKVEGFAGPRTSNKLQEQLTEDNLQATIQSWSNMTGFLCSMAGVSTKPSSTYSLLQINSSNSSPPPSIPSSSGSGTLPHHHHTSASHLENDSSFLSRGRRSSSYHGSRPRSVIAVPSSRLPEASRFSSSGDSIASADDSRGGSQTEIFITELISLLSCDNEAIGINIRESTKELISRDLGPLVYPCLFQFLQQEMGKIVQPDMQLPDVCDTNTVFVDQVVSITQRILDGKNDTSLRSLLHVKLDKLILAVFK